jgi:predicted glycogen debranching enzyme
MSYINFEKKQLVNLEYSLSKELIRTNRAGSYASTTLPGCNTRKYHGLLVSTQPQIDNQHHVFLSSLDATVIQREAEFNLGIHKYADDLYEPGGHKYIRDFESDPIPKLTYRVGGVILTMERVFASNDDRILIKYTLVEAHSPTKLQFRPLLAFRSTHYLSKANDEVDTSYEMVDNGIKVRMYEKYSSLFMQFSKKVKFIHKPDWYYDIEYTKEKTRGYDFKEDLYLPGYFEVGIKKGESIIFSAGLQKANPRQLKPTFNKEYNKRIPRNSFENCLINTAEQFFLYQNKEVKLVAGYHWFNVSARDAFIALPGISLTQKRTQSCFYVIDTFFRKMDGPFFPNNRIGNDYIYNSVDAPLWFFWSLQQFVTMIGDGDVIWKKYGKLMRTILEAFRNGSSHNIHVVENGLLYAGNDNDTLTWMNTKIDGKPVINRNGFAVEINALWYNAICFFMELSQKYGGSKKLTDWKEIKGKLDESFNSTFWIEGDNYLADVVRDDYRDVSVRPNQVIAASLSYSPLSEDMKYKVLKMAEKELLTPRGLRSLSPKNPKYCGIYKGNLIQRDTAYHQGSVFPWLLGPFAEAYLKLHGKGGLAFIQELYDGFEPEMTEHGIGSISELYYGDPPHKPKGSISQAWCVGEILRINYLINHYQNS